MKDLLPTLRRESILNGLVPLEDVVGKQGYLPNLTHDTKMVCLLVESEIANNALVDQGTRNDASVKGRMLVVLQSAGHLIAEWGTRVVFADNVRSEKVQCDGPVAVALEVVSRRQGQIVSWVLPSFADGDVLHQLVRAGRDDAENLQELPRVVRKGANSVGNPLQQPVASIHRFGGVLLLQSVEDPVEATLVLVNKLIPGARHSSHLGEELHHRGDIGDTQRVLLGDVGGAGNW